jgi:hypothetical protein
VELQRVCIAATGTQCIRPIKGSGPATYSFTGGNIEVQQAIRLSSPLSVLICAVRIQFLPERPNDIQEYLRRLQHVYINYKSRN